MPKTLETLFQYTPSFQNQVMKVYAVSDGTTALALRGIVLGNSLQITLEVITESWGNTVIPGCRIFSKNGANALITYLNPPDFLHPRDRLRLQEAFVHNSTKDTSAWLEANFSTLTQMGKNIHDQGLGEWQSF